MKLAYAGFDLMYPALEALGEVNDVIRLFTCEVDGDFETNDKVIAFARERGIPYTTARITPDDIDELIDCGCELLVSAGYYYRIPVDSRLPMVNIHPSLLPSGRGAWPMPLAILDDLPGTGVTVHKTEASFDTGDILMQKRFALTPDTTLESLMDTVNSLLPGMMRSLTADFRALWENAQPQGEGVYQDEPRPEDHILTAGTDAVAADRVLRAFYGYYTVYSDGGQLHRIRRGRAVIGENGGEKYPVRGGYIKILQDFRRKPKKVVDEIQ